MNKEFTIEQKAKAYDEAIGKAAALYKASEPMSGCNVILETIFSELRESEDEKIRKELLVLCRTLATGRTSVLDNNIDFNKWISWLEKQEGCELIRKEWLEHIKQSWYKEGFIDGKYSGGTYKEWTINDTTTLNELIDFLENGTVKLQHDLTRYANWLKIQLTPIEKQGEQKPYGQMEKCINCQFNYAGYCNGTCILKTNEHKHADKVEPKFHEGDWLVSGFNSVFYVESISEKNYHLRLTDGYHERMSISYVDRNCHLWTIEDAKDGDVLYSLDSNQPFIYKSRKAYEQAIAYCGINKLGKFFVWDTKDSIITLDKYIPATKEQCDLLFKKMREAEYEWGADTKELRKIEDEEYNGEDYGIDSLWHAKNILEETLGKVDGYQTDDGILEHKCAIAAVNKLYKQKPAE